jgi:hypothetical protein
MLLLVGRSLFFVPDARSSQILSDTPQPYDFFCRTVHARRWLWKMKKSCVIRNIRGAVSLFEPPPRQGRGSMMPRRKFTNRATSACGFLSKGASLLSYTFQSIGQ